jgi:hypothetical protein
VRFQPAGQEELAGSKVRFQPAGQEELAGSKQRWKKNSSIPSFS